MTIPKHREQIPPRNLRVFENPVSTVLDLDMQVACASRFFGVGGLKGSKELGKYKKKTELIWYSTYIYRLHMVSLFSLNLSNSFYWESICVTISPVSSSVLFQQLVWKSELSVSTRLTLEHPRLLKGFTSHKPNELRLRHRSNIFWHKVALVHLGPGCSLSTTRCQLPTGTSEGLASHVAFTLYFL